MCSQFSIILVEEKLLKSLKFHTCIEYVLIIPIPINSLSILLLLPNMLRFQLLVLAFS